MHRQLCLSLLASLALAGAAAAQDAPEPQDSGGWIEAVEEVYVPARRFDLVLGQHPGGIFLRPAEWHTLLERARRWTPPQAEAKVEVPTQYVLESCIGQGVFHEDTRAVHWTFEGELRVLEPGWVRVPLPKLGLALGTVRLDGEPAELVTMGGQAFALIEGPRSAKLSIEAGVEVKRRSEGPGGTFTFELPAASAGELSLDLPGRVDVTCRPATASLTTIGEGDEVRTRVRLVTGGSTAARFVFRPEEVKVRKEPYVIAEKATVFEVGQGVVLLDGRVDLRIQRQPLDAIELLLPEGFTMRTLSAESAPSWMQEGRRVSINLAEARLGTYSLSFSAERATRPGTVEIGAVEVPSAARESGVVGLSGRADVKLRVLAEAGLQRLDSVTPALTRLRKGGVELVYGESPTPFALKVETRAVEARVQVDVSGLVEFEQNEMRMRAVVRYQVDEGAVFRISQRVPSGLEVESVQIVVDEAVPAFDWRLVSEEGRREVVIELEEGVNAGQTARVILNAQRALPEGLGALQRSEMPTLGARPATAVSGFLGFAVSPSFELRGEATSNLTAVPADELVNVGIAHENLVLGYRIDDLAHSGQLVIAPRPVRVSVTSLVAHTVADRVLETRARLDIVPGGAPVRELVLWLPAGKGKNALIDGPTIKERSVLAGEASDEGLERLRLRFTQPQAEAFELLIDFDSQIAGFAGDGSALTRTLAPEIHVDGAERESGVIAVYSSDATEITATPSQLRPLEVTSVPKDDRMATVSRPLLAYSYVRPEYRLELEVQRYDDGAVLTALVEELVMESSVGVDGTARHQAHFSLKNLSHQSLDLELPKGSKLWSVRLDGAGLKPAQNAEGGHRLPLPLRGTAARSTAVTLTIAYEEVLGGLSAGRDAEVQAPKLLIPGPGGSRPVPVRKTSWELAVPDDSRIVSAEGNVQGLPSQRDNVLTLRIASWVSYNWDRGLSTVLAWAAALLIGGTVLIKFILIPLWNLTSGMLSDEHGLVFWKVGCLFVGLLIAGLLGLALLAAVGSSRESKYAPTASLDVAVQGSASAPGNARYADDDYAVGEDFSDSGAGSDFDGALEPDNSNAYNARQLQKNAGMKDYKARDRLEESKSDEAERSKGEVEELYKRTEELVKERQSLADKETSGRRGRRPSAPPMPKPSPMPARKPMAPQDAPPPPPMSEPAPDPVEAPEEPMLEELEAEPEMDVAKKLEPYAGRPMQREAGGFGGGAGGGRADGPGQSSSELMDATPKTGYLEKMVGVEGGEDGIVDSSRFTAEGESRRGLRSLVFSLPEVGRTYRLDRRGGDAWLRFGLLDEGRYRSFGLISVFLAFLASLLVVGRSERLNVLGWTLIVAGGGTAVSLVSGGAFATVVANGVVAGFLLAAPVHLAVHLVKRFLEARKRVHASRPHIRVIASFLLVGLVGFGSTAQAQEVAKPAVKKETLRVYVPVRADTAEERDQVYVPKALFETLVARAYPKPTPEAPTLAPAPFSFGQVRYEARLDGERLDVDVEVDVQSYGPWARVPLGLASLGLRDQDAVTVVGPQGPERPRLEQTAGGLVLILEAPGRRHITVRGVAARQSGRFAFGAVPAGAAELALTTADLENRIRVELESGGQSELVTDGSRAIRAFLGDQREVKVVVTAPEVMSVTGNSDASARNHSLFVIDEGVIRVFAQLEMDVVGGGWEGFRYAIPEGLSIVQVEAAGLREWRTLTDGEGRRVLELQLREAQMGSSQFLIEAERLIDPSETRLDLPEIQSLGVKREFGVVALAPAPGLKIRSQTSGSLYQVAPRELSEFKVLLDKAPGRSPDRAFRYGSRPTGVQVEFVHEPTVFKTRSRVRGLATREAYEWKALVEFNMTKGKAHELAFALSDDALEVRGISVSEGAVRSWRFERFLDRRWLVCDLSAGLSGRFEVDLRLTRRVRGESFELALPDLHPRVLERNPSLHVVAPGREDGAVVVAVADGLDVQPQGEVAGLEPIDVRREERWLELSEGETARLGFALSGEARSGAVLVSRLDPQLRGAYTVHAQVLHDVVRTRAHIAYEIERSGARSFAFRLPARFGDHVEIQAPNRRELRVVDVVVDGAPYKEYQVELQSSVRGLYELTFELEEVAAKDGSIEVPAVQLAGVERSRGYVLIEKDERVADELVLVGGDNVSRADAATVPALPPGRTPYSFIACWKIQQPKQGLAPWRLVYKLKKVRMDAGPAAVVDWLELTSVVHESGQVLNRARYSVRNRRMQFLELRLPEAAQVWAVSVAKAPKRTFRGADGALLVPLPKRVEADLSFQVELIYETSVGGSLGTWSSIEPQPPVVATEGLTVERSFWVLHVPEGYETWDVEANMDRSEEAVQATEKVKSSLQEIAQLAEVVKSNGRTADIAEGNVYRAIERASKQLNDAYELQTKLGTSLSAEESDGKQRQRWASNEAQLDEAQRQLKALQSVAQQESRKRAERRAQEQADSGRRGGEQVNLGGQTFVQSQSNGWCLNPRELEQKQAQWEGIQDNVQTQTENLAIFAVGNAKVQSRLAQTLAEDRRFANANEQLQRAYVQELQRGQTLLANGEMLNDDESLRRNLEEASRAFGDTGGAAPEKKPDSKLRERASSADELKAGLVTMALAFETYGESVSFSKDRGDMSVKLSLVKRSVFSRAALAAQVFALVVVVLLVFRFDTFGAADEPPSLWAGAFAVASLLTLCWVISWGWGWALLVGLAGLGVWRVTAD